MIDEAPAENKHEKVRALVAKIPKGKVSSYGDIAKIACIKDVRAVGWAINKNKDPEKLPCHRVVKSDGSLADGYGMGGKDEQRKRLLEEGIEFDEKNKIPKKYFVEVI